VTHLAPGTAGFAASDSAADRDLVEHFLDRRDERTFLALYRRHTPALLLLSRRLLGRGDREAEDAVQETWLRAAPRLARFRWESSLRTWLAGILVRCCHESHRAHATDRLADPLSDRAERDAPMTLRQAPERVDRIDLERALAALAAGYRQVLVLHDVEGYTHEEIAKLLEIDAGTSKSQLFRARLRLRTLLANGGSHDAPPR